MDTISKMFIDDARSNPCAFSQKRLHNPLNREGAFCFDMHETLIKMWGASLVVEKNPELFDAFLTNLKTSISLYEALKSEPTKELDSEGILKTGWETNYPVE